MRLTGMALAKAALPAPMSAGVLARVLLVALLGSARQAAAQDGGLASVHLGTPGSLSIRNSVLPGGDRLFAGGAATGLPGWLRWALAPQLDAGDTGGSLGGTGLGLIGQSLGPGYRGLSWSVPLSSGLLHQDDALSFAFSLGHGMGDLTPGGDERERRLLGPAPYLRLGAGLSYQVTPRLGLYVLFDHVAGAGPLHVDDTMNDLGMRVGLRF